MHKILLKGVRVNSHKIFVELFLIFFLHQIFYIIACIHLIRVILFI